MFYFKEISEHFPDDTHTQIKQQIMNYVNSGQNDANGQRIVLRHTDNDFHTLLAVPGFKQYLKQFLADLDYIDYFFANVAPAHYISPTHTDSGYVSTALNIPIYNYEHTFVKFFELKQGKQARKIDNPDGTAYSHHYFEDLDEVVTLKHSKPVFFNVHKPHAIYNPTLENRVVLSIRLKQDTDWLK